MLQLTFNAGLTITGFRTTRPLNSFIYLVVTSCSYIANKSCPSLPSLNNFTKRDVDYVILAKPYV